MSDDDKLREIKAAVAETFRWLDFYQDTWDGCDRDDTTCEFAGEPDEDGCVLTDCEGCSERLWSNYEGSRKRLEDLVAGEGGDE